MEEKNSKKVNIISIRLDDELLRELKEDAKKEYRPLAMHIRKILIDYLTIKVEMNCKNQNYLNLLN